MYEFVMKVMLKDPAEIRHATRFHYWQRVVVEWYSTLASKQKSQFTASIGSNPNIVTVVRAPFDKTA